MRIQISLLKFKTYFYKIKTEKCTDQLFRKSLSYWLKPIHKYVSLFVGFANTQNRKTINCCIIKEVVENRIR